MSHPIACGPCYHCKTDMWMPQELYDAAKRSSKITFYCAYGHGQCFAEGESEATKLRRDNARLFQQLAQKDDEIAIERGRVAAAQDMLRREKASAVKARKRSAVGLCPCCGRTFRQMALHMKNKHPEFKAEKVA